jgi:hypothetical protein
MDKDTWNFHITDFALGISMIMLFFEDKTLKFVCVLGIFVLYQLQIMNIQFMRKKGIIVLPLIFSLFPKKLKEQILKDL